MKIVAIYPVLSGLRRTKPGREFMDKAIADRIEAKINAELPNGATWKEIDRRYLRWLRSYRVTVEVYPNTPQ